MEIHIDCLYISLKICKLKFLKHNKTHKELGDVSGVFFCNFHVGATVLMVEIKSSMLNYCNDPDLLCLGGVTLTTPRLTSPCPPPPVTC